MTLISRLADLQGPDDLARFLFEACRSERLLNDIRGWDRQEGTEEYNGAIWQTVTTGLTESEKAKWRRVAALLSSLQEKRG